VGEGAEEIPPQKKKTTNVIKGNISHSFHLNNMETEEIGKKETISSSKTRLLLAQVASSTQ